MFSGVYAPSKDLSFQFCGQLSCLDPVCFLVFGHQKKKAPPSSADSRTVWIKRVFWCLGAKYEWHDSCLRTAELSGSSVFSCAWAPSKGGSIQFCGQPSCLDPVCFLMSEHQRRVAPLRSAVSKTVWIQILPYQMSLETYTSGSTRHCIDTMKIQVFCICLILQN